MLEKTKKSFQKGVDKLMHQWEENPLAVIGVTTVAMTAAGKLINAVSAAQGRRAYAKQVNYRVRTKR